MNIQHYLKKLNESEEFKDFKKENLKAYLCSAFFVRDFEGEHNDSQMDFYSPKLKKIVSFQVNGKVQKLLIEKKPININQKKFVPKKIKEDAKVDVDQIKDLLLDEMHNREITSEVKKLIAVLFNPKDKEIWNCTCFLSGLSLLHAHVDDESGSVLFMEKNSLFDILKPLRKNEKLEDVLGKGKQGKVKDKFKKTEKESKKEAGEQKPDFDIEKAEGDHEGFIG